VIPALDEAAALGALLDDLRGLATPHEVVVVDGGSADATATVAARAGARLVAAPRGRGRQLGAGAAAARGEVLCFLHADVRLDAAARRALDAVVRDRPPGAFAFRLAIDSPRRALRAVAWGANLRARWLALPYGDQGLVVARRDYDAAGGYPAWPLMEDVALARALARVTRLRLLPAAVHVSARRWERDGVVRRTLGNLWLLARFTLGASPHRLARHYRAGRSERDPEGSA
jgi:rSAM/selenodomain-associated transferase 2